MIETRERNGPRGRGGRAGKGGASGGQKIKTFNAVVVAAWLITVLPTTALLPRHPVLG